MIDAASRRGDCRTIPPICLRLVGTHCLRQRSRLDLFSLLFGYDETRSAELLFIIPLLRVLDDCFVGVSGLESKHVIIT
jgi:hypothetical protein